jgi:Glycosyl transferase family 2
MRFAHPECSRPEWRARERRSEFYESSDNLMRQPDVSVVLISFNNHPYITDALLSCYLDQSVATQVIVVDDCSTDGSRDLLEGLHKELEFSLILREHNGGEGAARTSGLAAAIGRYVNFLDGDDYLLPGKLARQVDLLDRDRDVSVCYCDARLMRSERYLNFTLKDVWPPHTGDVLEPLLERDFIAVHAALIRADALARLPAILPYRQTHDYELMLSLATTGRFRFVDAPLVVYRRTDSSSTIRELDAILAETITLLERWQMQELTNTQRASLHRHVAGIRRVTLDRLVESRDPRAGAYLADHQASLRLSRIDRSVLQLAVYLLKWKCPAGCEAYGFLQLLRQMRSATGRRLRRFEA